ncbi:MAG: hypothetical protein B5M53_05660 [Candidatus Cloacimonas sp. 4484_209]|nr:MAG: hypothetical protein B5M53_05660 [Candidatus Cloacimonas sp. 4484_209]
MKRLIFTALCFLILSVPLFAQDEPINARYGTLRVGGIIQTTLTYNLDTLETQTAFALRSSRLLFSGTVLSDRVKYFVQTEGTTSPYVLDTKVMLTNYIPLTTISIGRFLPNFTYYMPRSVAKLDLINYPLFVLNYGMWRQIGIQTTTKTDYVDFNLGVFNGYPQNNWTEDNDGKDILVSGLLKPIDVLRIIGYGWFGNGILGDTLDTVKNRYGGGVIFNKPLSEDMSVYVNVEYCIGSDEITSTYNISSAGYYLHLGFKVNPYIELLARYDNYDPDTDNGGDATKWITGGINYNLDGDHVRFSLNYIKKSEETAEYQNDQLITQFQLYF